MPPADTTTNEDVKKTVTDSTAAAHTGSQTDLQHVYDDIHRMQQHDGGNTAKFSQDLIELNKQLHDRGLLPNLSITGIDGQGHIQVMDDKHPDSGPQSLDDKQFQHALMSDTEKANAGSTKRDQVQISENGSTRTIGISNPDGQTAEYIQSQDGGKTWQIHTQDGKSHDVTNVTYDKDKGTYSYTDNGVLSRKMPMARRQSPIQPAISTTTSTTAMAI